MSDHGFDVIDAHHHIGGFSESMAGVGGEPSDAESYADRELACRLEILDSQGIGQAVVIAGHSYLRPHGIVDTRAINDEVARYRDRCPDRFPVGIGVVEPLYGEVGLPEIGRCRDELGLAGISFHTRFQGVSMDSRWVRRYLERMGELEMVAFVHALGQSPEESLWKVEALARDLPGLPMVVLDVFADAEQPRQVAEVAARNPALVFDTSLALSFEMLVEPAIRAVGADRFVFGSDTYSWPTTTRAGHVLGQILASGLDHTAKAAVLGGNLRRVLGLPT